MLEAFETFYLCLPLRMNQFPLAAGSKITQELGMCDPVVLNASLMPQYAATYPVLGFQYFICRPSFHLTCLFK